MDLLIERLPQLLNLVEEYRPVVGYEDSYEVSNTGRMRSVDRIDSLGHRLKGRELRPSKTGEHGYLQVGLRKEGERKGFLVHRLVYEVFIGPIPKGFHVDHIDNRTDSNWVTNLQALSPKDNISRQVLFGTSMADRVKDGTHHMTRKTHCKRGHKLVEPNLVPSMRDKGRVCLACERGRGFVRRNYYLRPLWSAVADIKYEEIMSGTD